MIIKDLTNSDIRKITKRKRVAIIPVGSIEQHGPHLPVSTDSDIISYIAKQVSLRTEFLLFPTIQYGISFEHHPFFHMSVTKTTLQNTLIDLCVSLWKNHIHDIIILNGHHGNHKALKQISTKVSKIPGVKARIFVYSYWHFMTRKFDHAGFVETSIMLAISDKVRMDKARRGLVVDKLSENELIRLSKLATMSFPSVTKNGIWGDPTKASAKHGKQILRQVIESLVKESQTCLTGKTRKLHQ